MPRHDQTGRSTGKLKVPERQKIQGQFIARRVTMLESPAFAALSYQALKAMTRLEIEHASQGGRENGKLIVTYDQFADAGVRRKSVPLVILELELLGFAEVTKKSRAAAFEFRSASTYRLTYLNTPSMPATDEWQRLDDAAVRRIEAELAERRAGVRHASSSQDIDSRGTYAPETVGAPVPPRTPAHRGTGAPDLRGTSAPGFYAGGRV